MSFDRKKLLDFLEKNPDKIPSMSKTLIMEMNEHYNRNIQSMSVYESIQYIYGNTGLIDKKVVDEARYGKC